MGSTRTLSVGLILFLGRWIAGTVGRAVLRFTVFIPEIFGSGRIVLDYMILRCTHLMKRWANDTQVSLNEQQEDAAVVCKHCSHTLGRQDTAADGWRIWKWSLSISSGPTSSPSYSTYSVQKWISARLLYLIENVGVRKFHIHPPSIASVSTASPDSAPATPPPTPSILAWVFTPDLLFSSSITRPHRTDPTRAVKCFFKKQRWAPLQPGEPESATIEDVEFPRELYEEMEKTLEESQDVLPATARKFQGWDVGLLERFDVGEEALGEQGEGEEGEGMDGIEGLGINGDDEQRRGRELRRSLSQESLD